MNLQYDSKGLVFGANSLEEAMQIEECLVESKSSKETFEIEVTENGQVKKKTKEIDLLSWHQLVTRFHQPINQLKAYDSLHNWGLGVTDDSTNNVEPVFRAKQRKYLFHLKTIEEVRQTDRYQLGLSYIKNKYSGVLPDGTEMFRFQIVDAALMYANYRLLLGFDMGMGKTRTTLVGLTSIPSIKKILIVTMSRNLNDWERECKNLGLGNDYIVLQNPTDMQSDKRIHLVSYEKWAGERVTYRPKLHEKCPTCQTSVWWNAQRQVCKICKKAEAITEHGHEVRYSKDDLPTKCPKCSADWKHGAHHCLCGFTVVEVKKKALSNYFHRGYDAAAIDEAQMMKNGNSKRSTSIRKIKTKYRVAMSGTPCENGAADLYWLIGWLFGFDSVFEDPLTRNPYQGHGKVGQDHFRLVYGGGGHVRVLDTDRIRSKVSRHEELWEILDTLLIRRKKQDSDVKDSIKVPEPIHHRHHLAMGSSERKLYDEKLEEFREWYQLELLKKAEAEKRGDKYRIQTIKICAWMDVLRKVASCPWTFEEYTSPQLPEKVSYLKNKIDVYMKNDQKVLIFTSHKKTAEVLAQFLDSRYADKDVVFIHGGVKKEERFAYMDRFQDPHDSLSVIVFTVRTGAESYTLTEAKGVFIYDLDFNGKKLQQCYSRAVRTGQRAVVDVYWLIHIDTIEVNMHGVILSKDSGVDLAIDKEELDFEKIAKQFEGEQGKPSTSFDYEAFATDMLARGTSRKDLGIA